MSQGPSVLCIGAQKAGTTWLYRSLFNRSDVWLPPVKELHYFDEKLGEPPEWFAHLRGSEGPSIRWRRQLHTERVRRSRVRNVNELELSRRAWCSRYFFDRPSTDWYRALFPSDSVSIDTTPEYATLSEPRIQTAVAALPDVRVIYLLRNPIEREWSGAQMRFRKNKTSLESVLRGRHPHARYGQNIDRWTAELPQGRMYIGFFDDIANRPAELLADILRFIDGDDSNITLPAGRPNSGNASTIPAELAVALAEHLGPDMSELAERFPGAATRWHATADWLRTSRPTGELRYPFEVPPELGGPDHQLSSIIM